MIAGLLSWQGLVALLVGGLYGAIFGSIPGLTATLAIALFVPLAFFLDPDIALPAIIAISSVAIFAGDVGSTVARIPGTPASAAYVEEIYDLAGSRGPLHALGIAALSSAVGGLIGTILLMVAATGIAGFASRFSSFEYFWVATLGLTAGIFASGGPASKAFVSLMIGLLFSTVGIDPTLGYPRFDFGSPTLLGGLDYVVAMIGLFGFSEVLMHLYRSDPPAPRDIATSHRNTLHQFYVQPIALIIRRRWLVLRSSLLGVFVGFLPGAGADVASWVAASIQKMRIEPDDEAMREGAVVAGTSSNNAAVASAWIPALSLGLPGDTVTAIVLSIFMMKGITPGPLLFQTDMSLVWALYGTFLVSSIILLPLFGYVAARGAAYVIRTPLNLLLPIVTALCVVGAYAMHNNPADVWLMVAMGVFAFVLRLAGFPLAQVVLGMVLGPILEQNFMVSAIIASWDISAFFFRPLAIFFMLCTIVVIVFGIRSRSLTQSSGLQ